VHSTSIRGSVLSRVCDNHLIEARGPSERLRAFPEPREAEFPGEATTHHRSLHAFANSAIVSCSNASAFFTLSR
jgi:hypothetical protein